jgi:hypothetical protein
MALQAILDEIDDISRATLNSVTLATMIKLIEQGRYGMVPEPIGRTV